MRRGQPPRARGCLIACLGMSLLLLSACSFGPFNQRSPLPPSRQVLRLGLDQYFDADHTIDPASSPQEFPALLIFPPLLTDDEHLNVEPWAAASLPTFDPTNNTYIFTIRSGLKWSDGTPIDANTFAYSLNRSLSPCTASALTYYLYPIKDARAFSIEPCGQDDRTIQGKLQTLIGDSLRVPTSQTLVIQLTAPAPYLLEALTTAIAFAQPEQLIERYGNRNWTEHLTGNGGFGGNLYRLKSITARPQAEQELDLVACLTQCGSPSGWGTHHAAPPLRELHVLFAGDTAHARVQYQRGALDAGLFSSASGRVSSKSSTFHQIPMLQITWLQLNWDSAPFTDLRARQAFALALDKDTLARVLGDLPTNHLVPEGNPGYDPGLLGPDETSSTTGNVALARKLLQSYADDACHGQFSRCPPITVWCSYYLGCGSDPVSQAILTYESKAIAMWRQAFPGYRMTGPLPGCNGCLGVIPPPIVHQIFTQIWIADYPDPQDWLSLQLSPAGINNAGSVNDPTANSLMSQADQMLNPTERFSLYSQAEQQLVFAVGEIPIGQSLTYYELRSTVAGFNITGLGYPSLDQWFGIQMMS